MSCEQIVRESLHQWQDRVSEHAGVMTQFKALFEDQFRVSRRSQEDLNKHVSGGNKGKWSSIFWRLGGAACNLKVYDVDMIVCERLVGTLSSDQKIGQELGQRKLSPKCRSTSHQRPSSECVSRTAVYQPRF